MRCDHRIVVIIPALNEEASIGSVLDAIPDWVDARIVVNNASTDNTPQVALQHGAYVVDEPHPGYGAACLLGIATANALYAPDIIVFLDADFSDVPNQMSKLVDPIIEGQADITISDRTALQENKQALTTAQFYGNRLACALMRLFWGHIYHDLGPFRAIRKSALDRLCMTDRNFGWTVEMQIRAVKHNLKIVEIPVTYRMRLAGRSKISGTISGVIKAGSKILYTVFREAL
jgi:glycosyltransferase involved in cell wall biosynthesis